LRGEVVVVLTTDRHERVAPGSRLFSDHGALVVRSARGNRGSEHRTWIVQFEGCSDRTAADGLRGAVLRAEPIDDPDELWAHELVGAEVVLSSGGDVVGHCVAVVANPAADLLELDTGGLVPVVFVVDFLTDVDPRQVVIDPPPGLLDL
jgi:16S rRNA processing protein RimM